MENRDVTASIELDIFIGTDRIIRINVNGKCILRVRMGKKCEFIFRDMTNPKEDE